MKILLTGKPGAGKTTVLQKVKNYGDMQQFGILSREIRDEDARRVGFEAVNMQGVLKTFAHTTEITSEHVVNGKFFVDLAVIDGFVVPEIVKGKNNLDALIFIDEIGRMQTYSKKFSEAVTDLLDSKSNVLATIVLAPEPWSIPFKTKDQVVLVHVSAENRDVLPELLHTVFHNTTHFQALKPSQQKLVIKMARRYFDELKYIQIGKLFKNAIPYVVQGKVKPEGESFTVTGSTNTHSVAEKNGESVCDCDLFNGRGIYAHAAGECSHIQAIALFRTG